MEKALLPPHGAPHEAFLSNNNGQKIKKHQKAVNFNKIIYHFDHKNVTNHNLSQIHQTSKKMWKWPKFARHVLTRFNHFIHHYDKRTMNSCSEWWCEAFEYIIYVKQTSNHILPFFLMQVKEHSNPWFLKMWINGVFVQFSDDYDTNVRRNITVQINSINNKFKGYLDEFFSITWNTQWTFFPTEFEWNDLYNAWTILLVLNLEFLH